MQSAKEGWYKVCIWLAFKFKTWPLEPIIYQHLLNSLRPASHTIVYLPVHTVVCLFAKLGASLAVCLLLPISRFTLLPPSLFISHSLHLLFQSLSTYLPFFSLSPASFSHCLSPPLLLLSLSLSTSLFALSFIKTCVYVYCTNYKTLRAKDIH